MEISRNPVGWFELPVSNMDRAIQFYETVIGINFHRQQLGDLDMAFFPMIQNGEGSPGSLISNENYTPSKEGVLIYLTAFSGDLANELGRVAAAGGKVLKEKTQISPDYGYMGLFIDSEGNRVALHSRE